MKESAGSFMGLLATAFTLAGVAMNSAVAQDKAGGLVTTKRLSAGLAAEIVSAAVDACAKMGHQVTAVIVDTSGVRQALLRGDGASIHTLDSSFYKAYTAVTYRRDTIDTVERLKGQPPSNLQLRLPNVALQQGGVVVRAGDEVIAAVGVGGGPGGTFDTQCARAGIDMVRDRLQ